MFGAFAFYSATALEQTFTFKISCWKLFSAPSDTVMLQWLMKTLHRFTTIPHDKHSLAGKLSALCIASMAANNVKLIKAYYEHL